MSNLKISDPKIKFDKLKKFPALQPNDKIDVVQFLAASRDVVSIIGSFGKICSPIVHDMAGNIDVIEKIFRLDTEKNRYLENLLINDSSSRSGGALLWLSRALNLIEQFLTNLYNDLTFNEDIQDCLDRAYRKVLAQHHGWILREAALMIMRWAPKRTYLIGHKDLHNDNLTNLNQFLIDFRKNLDQLAILLIDCNLTKTS